MNEGVKFPINTPVEVTLQFEAGKRVEGRYGEQVMFSLLDNRVMYVPPYVAQRFQDLAIGAREPLLLCKTQVKDGNRNRIEWNVRRAPQQPFASSNGTAAADAVVADTMMDLQPVGGMEVGPVSGVVREEEQPSANSTAPMARGLALHTNTSTNDRIAHQPPAPKSYWLPHLRSSSRPRTASTCRR